MEKSQIKKLVSILFVFSLITLQSCDKKAINIDDYTSEVATSYNQKIMEYAVQDDGLLTLKGLRTEAMIHTAMHNALNAIKPIYESYSFDTIVNNADPISAVAQAAFEVAIKQYPNQEEDLIKELDKWLSSIEDGESKTNGINLGKASAHQILKMRTNDKYNGEAEYTWHPMAPGVYAEFNEHSGTPEGFIFGAGWAKAKTFFLPNPSHFRSPPPPEINSDEYTKAFNEVKEVGSHESTIRTEDQAHLAMWWKDFVENSHNRLARELVVKENLNLWESVRLFALMNMSIYDAYICVFDNKFHYNHWRPYTAIRWAEHDENPDTEPDLEWNNLHLHTYPFPSYPSVHGTASAAAMTVLANTMGTGDEYSFEMRTEEVDKAGPFSGKIKMDPPTRSFNSYSEAAMEASMSRVYLGIHFRYDSEEGFKLGKQIGDYANGNFFTPLVESQPQNE